MHRPDFFDESQHSGHRNVEMPAHGAAHHDSSNAFQREYQQHLTNHGAHQNPYAEGSTHQHGQGLGHGHEPGHGREHGYGHEHGYSHERGGHERGGHERGGHEHGYNHEHGYGHERGGHEHGYNHERGYSHEHGYGQEYNHGQQHKNSHLPDLEIHEPSRPNHHKGGGAGEHYDSHVWGDSANRILQAAHAANGRAMWQRTDRGASGANEGCAASLSAVLRQAGVSHSSDESVAGLQNKLEREGWTRTSQPRPGDAVFGYGGRSKAHCGIVDEHYGAMDNHSSTGRWSHDNLGYFRKWSHEVFLRPPA